MNRYDVWIVWLLGSFVMAGGFLGAIAEMLNYPGFTFLSIQNFEIVGFIGMGFVALGAYFDKPELHHSSHTYKVGE